LLFLLVFDIKETEKFFVLLFFGTQKEKKILKVFYLFGEAEEDRTKQKQTKIEQ
jgi:hypothetical protein